MAIRIVAVGLIAVSVLMLAWFLTRPPIPPPPRPEDLMPWSRKVAYAHTAKAIGLDPRDRKAAIEEYRKALRAEPGFKPAMSGLAFVFHRSGRTSEAIPIWKQLAKTDDKEGQTAKRWLEKVGASKGGS